MTTPATGSISVQQVINVFTSLTKPTSFTSIKTAIGLTGTAITMGSMRNQDNTPLYTFTSFRFTPAGAYGPSGPTLTQMQTYANTASGGGAWTQSTTNLDCGTGTRAGMWLWKVPRTGLYQLRVAGASVPFNEGFGAELLYNARLTKGHVLAILVGHTSRQAGGSARSGAGGSFVYNTTTSTLLMVAGGAGGKGGWGPVTNAQTSQSGADGNTSVDFPTDSVYGVPGTGGVSGSGGNSTSGTNSGGIYSAGGGGGYSGDGGRARNDNARVAKSFLNGGHGGDGGAFGGGGSEGASRYGNDPSGACGGGGGGYSGGGAGYSIQGNRVNGNTSYDTPQSGGGGGSFADPSLTEVSTGLRSGPTGGGSGFVNIQLL